MLPSGIQKTEPVQIWEEKCISIVLHLKLQHVVCQDFTSLPPIIYVFVAPHPPPQKISKILLV